MLKFFKNLVKTAHDNGIKVMVWGWAHKVGNENAIIEQLDSWKELGIDGLKLDYFDGQSQDTTAREYLTRFVILHERSDIYGIN